MCMYIQPYASQCKALAMCANWSPVLVSLHSCRAAFILLWMVSDLEYTNSRGTIAGDEENTKSCVAHHSHLHEVFPSPGWMAGPLCHQCKASDIQQSALSDNLHLWTASNHLISSPPQTCHHRDLVHIRHNWSQPSLPGTTVWHRGGYPMPIDRVAGSC